MKIVYIVIGESIYDGCDKFRFPVCCFSNKDLAFEKAKSFNEEPQDEHCPTEYSVEDVEFYDEDK